jgi:isobutyryl-CoA mutase
VTRIYSPDDGREMGLVGMVDDMLSRCGFERGELTDPEGVLGAAFGGERWAVAQLISAAENFGDKYADVFEAVGRRRGGRGRRWWVWRGRGVLGSRR